MGTTLREIELFAVGRYEQADGTVQTYSEGDLERIVRTFGRISTGENPLHRVPVVVSHQGTAAAGWVQSLRLARVHQGQRLTSGFIGDFADVVPGLATAIKAKRYRKVSVEIKPDFRDNEGRSYGPCLWRVAVLGADVPLVKGLKDLPREFSHPRGISYFAELRSSHTRGSTMKKRGNRRFDDSGTGDGSTGTMTRDDAIAYLVDEKGINEELVDDSIPDAFLVAIAEAWQAEDGDEPADTTKGGNGGDQTAAQMAHRRARGGVRKFSHADADQADLIARTKARYERQLPRSQGGRGA